MANKKRDCQKTLIEIQDMCWAWNYKRISTEEAMSKIFDLMWTKKEIADRIHSLKQLDVLFVKDKTKILPELHRKLRKKGWKITKIVQGGA